MTDARGEALYCQSHLELYPATCATFAPIAGGIAGYAGPDSPMTQSFGLGLDGPVTESEIEALEEFYRARNADVNIELCPLADPSVMPILAQRGYTVSEFSNVLFRDLSGGIPEAAPISDTVATLARSEEFYVWAETVARGFSEDQEVSDEMREVAITFFHEADVQHILVGLDGVVIAAGAIALSGETASIFATSTLPNFRGLGAQSVLIRCCIETALEAGCTLAMATTACGSTSQRNFERQGFQVAFTRTKFFRGF